MTEREWRRKVRMEYQVSDCQIIADGSASDIFFSRTNTPVIIRLVNKDGKHFVVYGIRKGVRKCRNK